MSEPGKSPSTKEAIEALLTWYGGEYRWNDPQFMSDLRHILAAHNDPYGRPGDASLN